MSDVHVFRSCCDVQDEFVCVIVGNVPLLLKLWIKFYFRSGYEN